MGKKNQQNASQDASAQQLSNAEQQPKGAERHKLYHAAREEAGKRLLSGDSAKGSSPEIREAYEAILAQCKAEIGLMDSSPAQGRKLSRFEAMKAKIAG